MMFFCRKWKYYIRCFFYSSWSRKWCPCHKLFDYKVVLKQTFYTAKCNEGTKLFHNFISLWLSLCYKKLNRVKSTHQCHQWIKQLLIWVIPKIGKEKQLLHFFFWVNIYIINSIFFSRFRCKSQSKNCLYWYIYPLSDYNVYLTPCILIKAILKGFRSDGP